MINYKHCESYILRGSIDFKDDKKESPERDFMFANELSLQRTAPIERLENYYLTLGNYPKAIEYYTRLVDE